MTHGPLQLLVVGFEHGQFRGEILEVLRRLRDQDVVRLLDLLIVSKDPEGSVRAAEAETEAEVVKLGLPSGALIRALCEETDAGPVRELAEEPWNVADAIPDGAVAAVALLEHRWAVPLNAAITRAGGTTLADAWVHEDDLAVAGVDLGGYRPAS